MSSVVKVRYAGTQAKAQRMRRAMKTVATQKRLKMPRLRVHKTPSNIYAQLINVDGSVLAAASTVEKAFKQNGGNIEAAKWVGDQVAKRVLAKGVESVAFDRAGFVYHGRVKALAEAAREAGLKF